MFLYYFFLFLPIWELGASKHPKNTPTTHANIFHYREHRPHFFSKIRIFCIFPPEASFPPPTHFHRTSISPSTVFLIFGTPLDISATPYNVDILSSDTFLNS